MEPPYLDDFDDKAERYGEGCEDDQQRDEGDEVGTQARAFLAAAWGEIVMIIKIVIIMACRHIPTMTKSDHGGEM